MDAMMFLTNIALILLLGILMSALAHKFKVPDILLLIFLGIGLGALVNLFPLVHFPDMFLTTISILALAMIVFDSTSKINLKEFDTFSLKAIRLAITFFIFVVVLLPIATYYIYGLSLPLSILFATIMAGTAPSVILTLLDHEKSKIFEILKIESIINTPLTVIFPFLIVNLIVQESSNASLAQTFVAQITPFLSQFITGIGAGIFVGIILFKLLRKTFSALYSPLAVFIGTLAAYVLAENLNGNGVLAVTALGLFFGNINVKEKVLLLEFESVLAKSLYILVFVLIGSIVQIPLTASFFMDSGLLFLVYLIIRFIAVQLSSSKGEFMLREKIFLTLVSAKGIAVAVVTFALTIAHIEGITPLLDLILIFMLYSIFISSLAGWFSSFFMKTPLEKRLEKKEENTLGFKNQSTQVTKRTEVSQKKKVKKTVKKRKKKSKKK